jgi:phosphopantothenoylcysteine decarboxylase
MSASRNVEDKKDPETLFTAADHIGDEKVHVLLASSGSVATIKLPNITEALSTLHNVSIRLVLTKPAEKFLQGQSVEQPTLDSLLQLPNVDGIHFDEHEWQKPWIRGDKILHIELRRWNQLILWQK